MTYKEKLITQARIDIQQRPNEIYQILEALYEQGFEAGTEYAMDSAPDWYEPEPFYEEEA